MTDWSPLIIFAAAILIASIIYYLLAIIRRRMLRRLAQRLNGQLFLGESILHFEDDCLEIPMDGFIARLSFYGQNLGKYSVPYQRVEIRTPHGCCETAMIYRTTPLFSWMGTLLGGQDLRVNDPAFDRSFVIMADRPEWLMNAFSPEIKRLHLAQRHMRVSLDADSLKVIRVGKTLGEAATIAHLQLAVAYAKGFFGPAQPASLEAPSQDPGLVSGPHTAHPHGTY